MSNVPHERIRRHGERLAMACIILVVAGVSFRRAANMSYDFKHFYLDARYVWEHGELNTAYERALTPEGPQLLFYLPAVPLLLSPLTGLGPTVAASAWAVLQAGSVGMCLLAMRAFVRPPGGGVVALMLALPAVYEAAHFNQLSLPVLALLLAAMWFLERDKSAAAGACVGVAALFKLLPGVFLVWLALKRRWAAVAAALLAMAALGVLPMAATLGTQRTIDYHRAWMERNLLGKPAPGMIGLGGGDDEDAQARGHFLDYRNQSIHAVLSRLFVPDARFEAPWQPAVLSERSCAALEWTIRGALAAILLLAVRRRWAVMPVESRFAEFAAFLIAMQVFSPLMRQYYLVWTWPAVGVFVAGVWNRSRPGFGPAWLGLFTWAMGNAAWLWPLARTYGANLLMLVVMGGALLRIAAAAPGADANLASRAAAGDSVAS